MIQFNPKFNIGDKVYHITKESQEGIFVDIKYYLSTKSIFYLVALGFDNEVEVREMELTETKTF